MILFISICVFAIGLYSGFKLKEWQNQKAEEEITTEELIQEAQEEKDKKEDDFILQEHGITRELSLLKNIFRELSIIGKVSNHTKRELFEYFEKL